MIRLTNKHEKHIILFCFLFLPVLLLCVFTYYPAVKLLELSFTDWDGFSLRYDYIGFSNYIDLFNDKTTLMTFINNIAYLIVYLIQNVISLYLAIILNGGIKQKNFFKSSIFLPYILNGVAVAYMFGFLYDYNIGPINTLLRAVSGGQLAVKWLGNGYFSNISLGLIGLWRNVGFTMVLYLGALQSIPNELYEAAEADGANFYHKIRHIAIPGIRRIIELNLFMVLIGATQAYFEAFVVTGGGPAGRTETFAMSTLNIAFEFNNFGKASAMGVVLVAAAFLILSVQKVLLNKESI